MDELEFHRVLALFPVVRSRDYHAESESLKPSTSQTRQNEEVKELQDAWINVDKKGIDIQDAFWEKLRLAAKKKYINLEFKINSGVLAFKHVLNRSRLQHIQTPVGASEAEGFVKAFQHVYKKLVCEELSLGAAQRFINSS